jgi:hypothetical protein
MSWTSIEFAAKSARRYEPVVDLRLLYSDRDFDPFVKHLGLLSVLPIR